MSKEKLKPCPFCGGDVHLTETGRNSKGSKSYISCNCEVNPTLTLLFTRTADDDKLIKAWNRRTK